MRIVHDLEIVDMLNASLEVFGIRASRMITIHEDGGWSCQLSDEETGDKLGKIIADQHSTVQACTATGYDLQADFSQSIRADVFIVSNGPART